MSNICLELKLLHYVQTMACSGSWSVNEHSIPRSNIETAGPCGRPKIFFCHLPVFAVDVADDDESPASTVDLTGDGKLGYGFTSADDLEEVDIGPGDKPRPTFISKKLDPSLREPMIALLRDYLWRFLVNGVRTKWLWMHILWRYRPLNITGKLTLVVRFLQA